MYKIGGVRRNREEGKEHIVLADLLDEDGNVKLSGPLRDVIRICEERGYETSNLAAAKTALEKMG
jgi:hypothetical protein